MIQIDLAVPIEREKRLIESLAAFLNALLHRLFQGIDVASFDQIFDPGRIHEDFQRRHPFAVNGWNQPLRNNRTQVQRQLHINLPVTLRGKEIDDAFDRLVGIVRMQRAETEMASLGERDGSLHGLGVANFADQDNVRGLTQGILQRRLKRVSVGADLALGDDRLFMPMDELDGIFDRNDMSGFAGITVVDHRRQRGRLTGTSRAYHQDQTALRHGNVLEDRRQTHVIERQHIGLNAPHNHRAGTSLHEYVDTKTRHTRQRLGEIHLKRLGKFPTLLFRHHGIGQGFQVIRGKSRFTDRADLAFNAAHRRSRHRQIKV